MAHPNNAGHTELAQRTNKQPELTPQVTRLSSYLYAIGDRPLANVAPSKNEKRNRPRPWRFVKQESCILRIYRRERNQGLIGVKVLGWCGVLETVTDDATNPLQA